MSVVGKQECALGAQYNIYCSELSLTELSKFSELNNITLPKHALIISSPQQDGKDDGHPSILMTDKYGDILPLTYALSSDFKIVDNTAYVSSANSVDLSYYNTEISELKASVNKLTKILENICNEQNWSFNELSK